jgi:hypothetical protein
MGFFMWALVHDGARSLLIFLILFAVLNFFLLNKISARLKKGSANGGNTEA